MTDSECIAYESRFDTHAAFDERTKFYTILRSGEYLVKVKGQWVKRVFTAGTVIYNPDGIISSSCADDMRKMKEKR